MADVPRTWQVMQAVQARLQLITVAGGARTDLGRDVRLEPGQFLADDGPRITLYTGSVIRPDDARSSGERELTLIVEVAVPAAWGNAQQAIVDGVEDVEDILEAPWLPMTGALPLRFQDSVFLERPDGMPAMVAQIMFATGWRR